MLGFFILPAIMLVLVIIAFGAWILAVISGRSTVDLKTETCPFCGYTWEMRRPHTIWNPPSRCPNCGKKILRESDFMRALEENQKKLNEESLKKMNEYREFREKLRNDFSKNESEDN